MIDPEDARRDSESSGAVPNYVGGYAKVVHVYIQRGWTPPLPLPHGQKWPPPIGFTGGGAEIPTLEQVDIWCCEKTDGNPALYLAEYDDFALLGVDIDNYAKKERPAGRALEVIAEVERRARCKFGPTFVLRIEPMAVKSGSTGCPRGYSGEAGWRGCDLIHHGHRYVNAGVNPDTGTAEQWFDCASGRLLLEPPRGQDFAELPAELVREMSRGDDFAMPTKASDAQAKHLLDNLPAGAMHPGVRDLMIRALSDLSGLNGSRHDATYGHVRDLVKYGGVGLTGTGTALALLKHEFVEAVWDTKDRNHSTEVAAGEFDRMRTDAARRVAALTPVERAMGGGACARWSMAPRHGEGVGWFGRRL